MKSKLVFGLLFLYKLASAAELPKGTTSLSGQVLMRFQSLQKGTLRQNEFTFGVYPDLGFFATRQFSLGPRLGYQFSQETSYVGSVSGQSRFVSLVHQFTLGPFLRYYVRLGEKSFLSIMASPAVSYGSLEPRPSAVKTVSERVALDLQAGPSLHIFIHPRLALDIGLHYHFMAGSERFRIQGNVVSPVGFSRHGFLFSVGFSNFFFRLPKS